MSNQISIKKPSSSLQRGMIFENPERRGDCYILTMWNGRWCALGLNHAALWREPALSPSEAVSGLEVVPNGAVITLQVGGQL